MRTEMFPLALYLKSDAAHGTAQLTLDGGGIRGTVVTGTRHADTATLRFVCTNLPVPLLFGQTLGLPFGPSAFELAVPAADAPATATFDCFGAGPASAGQHLDLCGILFVTPA
jgi:hypothetical protein